MNKQTNWTKGKLCSQAAHASMKVFFDRMRYQRGSIISGPSLGVDIVISHIDGKISDAEYERLSNEEAEKEFITREIYECIMTKDMADWKDGDFTKIVLNVENKQNIEEGYSLAKKLDIPAAIVKDNGTTQASDEGYTCAIGPFNIKNQKYGEMTNWLQQFKLI